MPANDAATDKAAQGGNINRAVLFIRGLSEPRDQANGTKPVQGFPGPFVDLVLQTLPGAAIIDPQLEIGMFSIAHPDTLVKTLLDAVDEQYKAAPFDELIIIAFSAGTVLARSLYASACGAVREPDGRLDPSASRDWAPLVSRLVLLAGVTRGWELSTATPAWMRFLARPLLWLSSLAIKLRHPDGYFIQQIKRGSPFVVESRLKLLQVELAQTPGDPGLPHTVLLLGSKDEFVSPADAMDLGPSDSCS
jgi:hypothetical protein